MSTAAKVGAFFLAALVLVFLMIWKIQGFELGAAKGTMVSAAFKNVAGLDAKAIVRLAGVEVGRVDGIRLENGSAIVDIRLREEVRLREGATAAVTSLGFLGEKYVELTPGPTGAAPLPDGATIRGEDAVTFDEIAKMAHDIEKDVKGITDDMKSSVKGALGEERLTAIVDNVLALSRDLRRLVETNQANIDATTSNFRDFSASMTTLVDRVDRLVAANSPNVTQGIESAKDLSAKLGTTADNVNAITDKIRSGQGTIGQLVQSDETSKNLNDALVSVKEGVQSLNEALSTAKKISLDLAMRAEYYTSSADGKAYFTVDVIPKDKPRFYRLGISTDPLGRRTTTDTIRTITFPDGHTETILEEEIQYQNKVNFTAEVGYKWKDMVLRAGVMESSGGVGVDYIPMKKRYRFSGQIWDFGRPDDFAPHAKIWGSYYFSPSVFLSVGWDDFLNTSRKADSFLFGAGVRWGDEDIKYLAGAAR